MKEHALNKTIFQSTERSLAKAVRTFLAVEVYIGKFTVDV